MIGVRLGGNAVVCCAHGRAKRETVELEFDAARATAVLCMCCENLFLTHAEAVLCPDCKPKGAK